MQAANDMAERSVQEGFCYFCNLHSRRPAPATHTGLLMFYDLRARRIGVCPGHLKVWQTQLKGVVPVMAPPKPFF
jgi:hypothetical protein